MPASSTGLPRVLIIAYLFPSIGGGGVQRSVKMAKYLGMFGWQVHVLTVEPKNHILLDETLLRAFPQDVVIHRSKELFYENLAHSSRAPSTAAITGAPSGSEKGKPDPGRSGWLGGVKKPIRNVLKKIKPYLLVPDDQILWYPSAAAKGLKVIAEQQIDIIFSTSSPYTNHLVGLYLKRKTGKPWITDFRDPWTQNMHRTSIRWREWLEDRLERMVHREADILLTVTNAFAANFRKKFAEEIRRVEVIHNGFDREDYEFGEQEMGEVNVNAAGQPVCTFIYTGIFYKERNPRLFLSAIRQLADEGVLPLDRVSIRFAGVFDYPGYTENMDCVRELGLEQHVRVMGHLPHREALLALKRADVLILIGDTDPDSGSYIPGKLYEYMAVGRPILALSLPGESTGIIERHKLGEVVEPSSINQIKAAALKLYRQWDAGLGMGREAALADEDPEIRRQPVSADKDPQAQEEESSITAHSTLQYERKEQARLLALLMDELVSD